MIKYFENMDQLYQMQKIFYCKAKEKLDLIENLEHNDTQLREKLCKIELSLKKISKKITLARTNAGLSLKKTIETELIDLGFYSY